MKTFSIFFSSQSSVDDANEVNFLKAPGSEAIYDLKKHIEKLSKVNSSEKDGFDYEFEVRYMRILLKFHSFTQIRFHSRLLTAFHFIYFFSLS